MICGNTLKICVSIYILYAIEYYKLSTASEKKTWTINNFLKDL